MRVLYLILIFFVMSGCTFQSAQYDIIKGVLIEGTEKKIPEPTWKMQWQNVLIDLYAVNNKNDVYFARDNILVHFDGWEVVTAQGLSEKNERIKVEVVKGRYEYFLGNQLQGVYDCEKWSKSNRDALVTRYTKKCFNEVEVFENSFEVNDKKELISITYRIIPEFPLLSIYLDKNLL